MELTDKQRQIMTMIVDRLNTYGYVIGMTDCDRWCTNIPYTHSDGFQTQGPLDRIGKLTYVTMFHIDESREKYDFFKPIRLGPDLYDHSIWFDWKEPIGKGWGPNPPECMMNGHGTPLIQDKCGNWHSPGDTGKSISLYHPSVQADRERVDGCWLRRWHDRPHWRPTYHFTREEVIDACQLICKEFGWEFEDGGESCMLILFGEEPEETTPKETT